MGVLAQGTYMHTLHTHVPASLTPCLPYVVFLLDYL